MKLSKKHRRKQEWTARSITFSLHKLLKFTYSYNSIMLFMFHFNKVTGRDM